MRRLWDATLAVPELHYRITLTQSCHADLAWWRYLLDTWNGRSFFLQPGWSPAPHMHLLTDASGTLGYGAYFGGRWFSGTWLPDQQTCCITYKELYPIALACSTWGHEWSSLRVEFHSDNQAVVSSLRKGSCRCSNVMSLLRRLFLVAALQKFQCNLPRMSKVWLTASRDSLSRQDFDRFRTLAPQAAAIPDTTRPLPSILGEPSLVPCTSTHSNRQPQRHAGSTSSLSRGPCAPPPPLLLFLSRGPCAPSLSLTLSLACAGLAPPSHVGSAPTSVLCTAGAVPLSPGRSLARDTPRMPKKPLVSV